MRRVFVIAPAERSNAEIGVSTPPRSCLRQRGRRPWSGRSRAGAAGPASSQYHRQAKVFGRSLPRCWMCLSRMIRSAALLRADHCPRDAMGQPALGALKAFMLLTDAPAASSTRCPLNLNSHNHNQHAGRPCFSLAFLIGRTKSTLNYAILRFRAHEQIPFSLHRCGQSPPVNANAVCILQAGSMRSFAFGTWPSHALHQVHKQGCPSSLALSSRGTEAGKK